MFDAYLRIDLQNASVCPAPAARRSVDGRISRAEVRALSADIANHATRGITTRSDQPCLTDPAYGFYVVGGNTWGDRFFLLGNCTHHSQGFGYFRDDETKSWIPSDVTIHMLRRHLPAR